MGKEDGRNGEMTCRSVKNKMISGRHADKNRGCAHSGQVSVEIKNKDHSLLHPRERC